MPAQVSESEIEVVASTVAEQWPALAKILGISEPEYSNFMVRFFLERQRNLSC